MLEFNNSHIPPLFANKHKYHKICCKSYNSSTQQYDETYGNTQQEVTQLHSFPTQ